MIGRLRISAAEKSPASWLSTSAPWVSGPDTSRCSSGCWAAAVDTPASRAFGSFTSSARVTGNNTADRSAAITAVPTSLTPGTARRVAVRSATAGESAPSDASGSRPPDPAVISTDSTSRPSSPAAVTIAAARPASPGVSWTEVALTYRSGCPRGRRAAPAAPNRRLRSSDDAGSNRPDRPSKPCRVDRPAVDSCWTGWKSS